MQRLDDFVREKIYQRLADWVMDHFERSCFWLASQAALLVFCSAVACAGIRMTMGDFDPMTALWAAFSLILSPVLYRRAAREEIRWRANESALRLDTLGGEWNRMVWLVLSVWELLLLLDAALGGGQPELWMLACIFVSDIAVLSHEYFMVCRPRPPRRRRAVRLAMGAA